MALVAQPQPVCLPSDYWDVLPVPVSPPELDLLPFEPDELLV